MATTTPPCADRVSDPGAAVLAAVAFALVLDLVSEQTRHCRGHTLAQSTGSRSGGRHDEVPTLMNLFTFEQTRALYRADFVFYGGMIVLLTALVLIAVPNPRWVAIGLLGVAGLLGWTALEYLVHRFVLHGVQPFKRWHRAHHLRPSALICAPTILTASIIATCLFLPLWAIAGLGSACALTCGLICGYLAYALTHHAIHHWRAKSPWLRERKHWHVVHHHEAQPCCYGATSGFWDRVCRTSITAKPHGSPLRRSFVR